MCVQLCDGAQGAIYWQANDIWQGASWASIEYGGRWKMLQYYAKNFYSPVLVSLWSIPEQNDLGLYVVSDLMVGLPLAMRACSAV